MSALGSLVVNLSLNHAEYTKGLDRNSQAALKFAKNSQDNFDRAGRAANRMFKGMAAGAVGVIASFTGASAAATKFFDAIDKSDSLAKLSQQTGIAVEQLAGLDFAASQSGTSLDRVAKGVRSFARVIADSSGVMNKNVEILQAMGIEMDDLRDKTPEEQFLAFADAVEDLGEKDRAVAVTALLGDRMAELVPLLSGGSDRLRALIIEGQRYNPVTAESAAQAELFNDNLDRLKRTTDSLFISLSSDLVPGINRLSESMLAASKNGGLLRTALAGVVDVALQANSGLNDSFVGKGFLSLFLPGSVSEFLDRVDQVKQSAVAVDSVAESVKKLESKTTQSSSGNETFARTIETLEARSAKASSSVKQLTRQIDTQDNEAEELSREIQRLTRAYDPLIKRNEDLARLVQLRDAGLPANAFDQEAIRIINEYMVATDQAADSVDEITAGTERLGEKTIDVFGSNEQFIISSMRRIQGSVADSLFNFFDDGLSGMVRSVKSALGRIATEFLSVKLLQGSGLGALFGLGGGAALASGSGSGIDAFDITSLGTSALSLVNSGFGATSLIGKAAVNAGQFLNISPLVDFGTAALSPGIVSGGGGLAASAGSSLASFAGPAIIAAAVDFGLRELFGDKKIGGTAGKVLDFVPVLGPLINGLFGLGAPKFNREELVGTVGTSGFEGALNQGIKQKGGPFKKSRFSNFIVDTDSGELLGNSGRLSESFNFPKGLKDSILPGATKRALEVGDFLDETFISLFDTLKNTAEILGISQESLKDFNVELDLVSEKGEMLSEQQISDAIADVSNQMVESLIPSINELSRSSESATDTLTRLGAEFQAIETGFILSGESVADARAKTQALGFDKRTDIVDQFGGAAGFQAKVDFFNNNVLSETEQIETRMNQLEDGLLTALDGIIDFIPPTEQLAVAFREGNDRVKSLVFTHQEAIVEYNNLKETLEEVSGAAEEAANEERALANYRRAFTAGRREFQTEQIQRGLDQLDAGREASIRAITEQAEKQKDLVRERYQLEEDLLQRAKQRGGVIQGFIDSLTSAARNILPDTFSDAFNLVTRSIGQVRGGASFDSIITDRLKDSLGSLSGLTSANFRTFEEFKIAQGEAASAVNELAGLGENQLSVENLTLQELEKQTVLLDSLLQRDLNRVDSGAQFDINSIGSFAGLNTADDTFKKIISNQFARTAFVLANDINPDAAAVADARRRLGIVQGTSTADIHRSLPVGFSPSGQGLQSSDHMTRVLIDEIKRLSLLVNDGNRSNAKTALLLGQVIQDGDFMRTGAA